MAELLTLDDVIEYYTSYSMVNFSLYEKLEDITCLKENIVTRYKRLITPLLEEYTLSEEARQLYNYKPELLSAKLYGTPDLSWFILMINSFESPSRFRLRQKIKLLDPDNLKDLFEILSTKNTDEISENHLEYSIKK